MTIRDTIKMKDTRQAGTKPVLEYTEERFLSCRGHMQTNERGHIRENYIVS